MTNKKSFIFTLDAILAVLIAGIIITGSYFYSQADIKVNEQNLYKISLDALAVLEKDGTLKNSVTAKSTSELNNFLNSLKSCGNFTIFDNSSKMILSVQKDCNMTQPVFSRRIFIANFSTYYAQAKLSFS